MWLRLAALSVVALSFGGCTFDVLEPRGPIAAGERLILLNSLAIMMVIVVPVIAATIGFAWWFRAGNEKATYLPEWEFSGRLELIVWSIPILIIVFLGGIAFFGSHALDPFRPIESKEKPLEVQVVSMDWKWLFIYPEQGVASVNELTIPSGRPVHFQITSASVWNTFFIPQLGGMIYSMAGMTSQLHLQADEPGTFRGRSGMYSGEKFSDMHFEVHALKGDDFSKWVEQAKASASALDTATYAKLAQTSDTAPIATYKSVAPDLFDTIVAETAPPTAGPPDKTNP